MWGGRSEGELPRLLEKTEEGGHLEGEVVQVVWGCESSEPDASREVSHSHSLASLSLTSSSLSLSLSLSLAVRSLSHARAS